MEFKIHPCSTLLFMPCICVDLHGWNTLGEKPPYLNRRAWMGSTQPNGRRLPVPLLDAKVLEGLIFGAVQSCTNQRWMDGQTKTAGQHCQSHPSRFPSSPLFQTPLFARGIERKQSVYLQSGSIPLNCDLLQQREDLDPSSSLD